MAVRYEPASLASKPLRESGSGVSSTTRLFNAELDIEDGGSTTQPYLAEALPRLHSDTWQVFPDGRMETIHRLRPDLVWHDGAPLVADDFVFAWRLYIAPALAVAPVAPVSQMEELLAPDPRTVMIRWRRPYPDAAAMAMEFQALPRHVLEQPFERSDPDAFLSHPYWTTEYLGAGPYRLQRWEPGALIEALAFDRHVLGRPKIDRVTVRFFADENVAFTNLLAGEVQYATGRSLRFEHGSGVKREWDATGKGSVIFTPDTSRFTAVQFRPDLVSPAALGDLRVRRALLHGVDRQALNEGIFDGALQTTDMLFTRYSRYERVPDMELAVTEGERAMTHYPYEARRAEQLMLEAGFVRGADGVFASGGDRFSMEAWFHTSSQYEKEQAILVDSWTRAGFGVRPIVLSAAALRDNQLRASFPGVYTVSSVRLESLAPGSIPTPANRWTGSNRGGWVNTEYDRLWDAFNATIDPTERTRELVQMLRLFSEEIPGWVLYYNPSVAAHYVTLRGPNTASLNADVWNVYEWELR
jgi:peptide/nickel transport system substrate-binding protein